MSITIMGLQLYNQCDNKCLLLCLKNSPPKLCPRMETRTQEIANCSLGNVLHDLQREIYTLWKEKVSASFHRAEMLLGPPSFLAWQVWLIFSALWQS